MKCAVCLWTRLKPYDDAITIANGTAVCEAHLHLTTSDNTVSIARLFKQRGTDPYQPDED